MKWHLLGFLQGFLYQLLSDDRRDSHLQNFIVCPLSRNEKCNCLVNSIFYQLAVLERKGPKNFEKIANNKKPKKWPITKNLKKRQIKKKLSRNEKCNCLVNSIFYLRERAAHQRRGEKTKIALLTFLPPPRKYCQEKETNPNVLLPLGIFLPVKLHRIGKGVFKETAPPASFRKLL